MLGEVRSRVFVEAASIGLMVLEELSAVMSRRKMGVSMVSAPPLDFTSSSVSVFSCGLVAEFSTAAMREAAAPDTALATVERLWVTRGVLTVDLGVTIDDAGAPLMEGEKSDRDDVRAAAELLEKGRIS